MSDHNPYSSAIDHALERKVSRSKWALFLERLWPRVWLVLGVIGIFLIATVGGLWASLTPLTHAIVLGAFALALLVSLIVVIRTPWPDRETAIRRLEKQSGIAHRPASSYEDTLSSNAADDPRTRTIWQAHRAHLAAMIERLRVGRPEPHTARKDPFALRALLILGVVTLTALAGEGLYDRVVQAFDIQTNSALARTRIDAWVTPPAYTSKPPIMLADGGNIEQAQEARDLGPPLFEIPERSVLIVRGSGAEEVSIALEVQHEGGEPETVTPTQASTPGGSVSGVAEIRYEIRKSARIKLIVGGSSAAIWTFSVDPDLPPKIVLKGEPRSSRRGSMRLTYDVTDDYGVASAQAKVVKAPEPGGDPTTAWARKDELKGPRPPLQRPPKLDLQLPAPNSEKSEASTYLELGAHPWAGLRVIMTLEATDLAGNIGRSEPAEIVLPQRIFRKPLARAVIEQRKNLVIDARYRKKVARALDALTIAPKGFMDDLQVYLGLRSAYHRLLNNKTRKGLMSVIDQLWQVAVRIEDGDLSDAERRLREAQEKLSNALKDGASDEEIQKAMDELRQALNEFMDQMRKEAQNNPMEMPGQDPDSQFLSERDLDRMMRDIEKMAQAGSKEQAQQMLSELRDLLDQMQAGKANKEQMQQNQQAMQNMKDLGDLVGQQQKLMDDTSSEQRRQQQQQGGQQGRQQGEQRGQMSQRGQPGRQGHQRSGQQGQQQGQRGQGPPQAGMGREQLGQRQQALRQRLSELQKQIGRNGTPSPKQLNDAQKAMERAEQALQNGDLNEAAQQQAEALENMRKGAQEMAQQMMQNSPRRMGENGDTPRDPLGRPQRSQGPDLGTSVKVPDEIDIQRAREILDELRRRLGERLRPADELEYLERLLRRF